MEQNGTKTPFGTAWNNSGTGLEQNTNYIFSYSTVLTRVLYIYIYIY